MNTKTIIFLIIVVIVGTNRAKATEKQDDVQKNKPVIVLLSLSKKISESKTYSLDDANSKLTKIFNKPDATEEYFKSKFAYATYNSTRVFAKNIANETVKAVQQRKWERGQKLFFILLRSLSWSLDVKPETKITLHVKGEGEIEAPQAYLLMLRSMPASEASYFGIGDILNEMYRASNEDKDVHKLRSIFKAHKKDIVSVIKSDLEYYKNYSYKHKDRMRAIDLFKTTKELEFQTKIHKMLSDEVKDLNEQAKRTFSELIKKQNDKTENEQ